jgi:hypothetical protein
MHKKFCPSRVTFCAASPSIRAKKRKILPLLVTGNATGVHSSFIPHPSQFINHPSSFLVHPVSPYFLSLKAVLLVLPEWL